MLVWRSESSPTGGLVGGCELPHFPMALRGEGMSYPTVSFPISRTVHRSALCGEGMSYHTVSSDGSRPDWGGLSFPNKQRIIQIYPRLLHVYDIPSHSLNRWNTVKFSMSCGCGCDAQHWYLVTKILIRDQTPPPSAFTL
jgi:hypothetical protein